MSFLKLMMTSQPLHLSHDGTDLIGQVFAPPWAGPHPAVLIFCSATGISKHELRRAALLAEQGYLACVADMYGGGVQFDDPAKAGGEVFMALLKSPNKIRSRVVAWFDALCAQAEVNQHIVAAIGYCFGGRCALELARGGTNLRVAISYHGLLTTDRPAQSDAIKAEIALFTGDKDPYAPSADIAAIRAELTKAGARWQITEFGGVEHSFTDVNSAQHNRPGIAYDAVADHVSWAASLALLAQRMGSA